MSCEHAQTTTLLWLYGEADARRAGHVAACAECSAVVAEHEGVLGTLAAATEPAVGAVPEPANASLGRWLAVAAALVLALATGWIALGGPDPEPPAPAVAVAPEPEPWADLDAEIRALDAEMDDLAANLYTL